ncbi:MAG: S8 family serine peptidase [Lactobacillaceae bacterium]|nr:S8 family serine peptidase [Lactobacillaceae bacterium]
MNKWVKKSQMLMMVAVLLINTAAPLIMNINTALAEATEKKATAKETLAEENAKALATAKEKRIAAVKKTWDAAAKASVEEANKPVEVFVELSSDAAYKEAPTPTGSKSNIKKIREKVQSVVDAQTVTKVTTEGITGTKVKQQSGYLVNGFSIKASPKEVQKIQDQMNVAAVYPVQEYKAQDADALELGNATAAWNASGIEHKGDGMVVADIDSGIDVTHKDFSTNPPKPALTADSVKAVIADKHLPGKYYSDKIPYGYNYAENNDVIYDSGINHMHGMHVAGIIAADGTDYVKQKAYDDELAASGSEAKAVEAKKAAVINNLSDVDGVAPHAQLLAMKVFSNSSSSAFSPVILRAIEDSVLLGADVLNLSIGSACSGNADDVQEIAINNAAKLGVLPVIAAGNSGNYSDTTHQGTNEVKSIKEQETVGAPGVAENALTVASENNTSRMVDSVQLITEDGETIFKDIKVDKNKTASYGGFKFYDTENTSFLNDADFNFMNEGDTYVDGKRVAFQMLPLTDTIADKRQNIQAVLDDMKEKGITTIDGRAKMNLALDPRSAAYAKAIDNAKTVQDLQDILDKYYPQPVADGQLGRGYVTDLVGGYNQNGTQLKFIDDDSVSKIMIISQSEITQAQLTEMARKHHISGIVIVADDPNAKPGETSFSQELEISEGVPTIMVSQADGKKLTDYLTSEDGSKQKLQILRTPTRIDSTTPGTMSYYSSWGLTPELNFKPEITAPGGNIWSTLNGNALGEMSGTSMATPFVSGAEALLLQDLKQTGINGLDKVKMAKVRMENSATPVYETYTKNNKQATVINSVRQQGAGAINVEKAITNQTILSVHGDMTGTLSLKQISGSKTFKLDITNGGTETKKYKIDQQTGQVYGQTTSLAADGTTKELHEYQINKNKASITNSVGNQTISVLPGATKTVTVTLNISGQQAKDTWLEAYFGIKEVGSDNTNVLPIVAYYGNLDKEPIIDDMSGESDSVFNKSSLSPTDSPAEGFGYSWSEADQAYKFNKDDIWYSTSANELQNGATRYLYRSISLTRNVKTLKGYLTDKNNKVVTEINSKTDINRSYGYSYSVIDSLSVGDFGWNGDIVSPTSGDRIQAPEGDYTYHLEATSQLANAKTQEQKLTIHIDTTKPEVKNLVVQKQDDGYHLIGDVSDARSGLNGLGFAYITINDTLFQINATELLGKGRAQSQHIDYVLSDRMQEQIFEGKNTFVFSFEDYAHNWVDASVDLQNGEMATGFSISMPALPTKTTIDDDEDRAIHSDVLHATGDLNSDDPYGVFSDDFIYPYTYMESYETVNPRETTDLNFNKSELDPVNHRIRIKGTSAEVFYVNGQKITPDSEGIYNTWITYDTKKIKVATKHTDDLRIYYLTYSTDAEGKDVFEKRPIDIFSRYFSAPIMVVDSDDMYDSLNPRVQRTLIPITDFQRAAITELNQTDLMKFLGYDESTDFTEFMSLITAKEDLQATYNVAATSGDVHIINKTAGESATDSATIVKKAKETDTNVTREVKLQEGFNIIESYTDENPDAVATTIAYYTSKKAMDNALTLDNFDRDHLTDYNDSTKTFTLKGSAGDNITGIKLLNNSTDLDDPKNQVTIKDNQWTFDVKLENSYGYKTWTMIVNYKNGEVKQFSLGGFYDFIAPKITFDDTTKWTGNDTDGYDVTTNKNSFTFKGTAFDNVDGYAMYVNGTHVLTSGSDTIGDLLPGKEAPFTKTFNLEKDHVSTFEWKIMDRIGIMRYVVVRVHQGNS